MQLVDCFLLSVYNLVCVVQWEWVCLLLKNVTKIVSFTVFAFHFANNIIHIYGT